MSTGKPASAVKPHPFVPDPDVPADMHGRRYCSRCGLPGTDGDGRHAAVAEDISKRITGEGRE